jgi:hypothetical protein
MHRSEKLIISVNKLHDGYNDYKTFDFVINNISSREIKVNGENVEFNNLGNKIEFEASVQDMTIEIML